MITTQLSYESVDIADLTRLLRHLEQLQGSTQQFSDCKRGYTNLPSFGYASAADQKRVALSQFVADLSAVKASMDWLVQNSQTTSTDTTNSGESSTQTGLTTPMEGTGTLTLPEWICLKCESPNYGNSRKCWHCEGPRP